MLLRRLVQGFRIGLKMSGPQLLSRTLKPSFHQVPRYRYIRYNNSWCATSILNCLCVAVGNSILKISKSMICSLLLVIIFCLVNLTPAVFNFIAKLCVIVCKRNTETWLMQSFNVMRKCLSILVNLSKGLGFLYISYTPAKQQIIPNLVEMLKLL